MSYGYNRVGLDLTGAVAVLSGAREAEAQPVTS
jgi:hypothetical protein